MTGPYAILCRDPDVDSSNGVCGACLAYWPERCQRCGSLPVGRPTGEDSGCGSINKEIEIMAKRGGGGPKPPKRKRVTVKPVKEFIDKSKGEKTEPYRIMEETIEQYHEQLQLAKIAIAWRSGWKANADGHRTLGRMKKASDVDRAFASYDFVLLLNEEAWPALNDQQKRILVDHELTHAQPAYDNNGEQKVDDKDRLCWRIKKHDIEEFHEIFERHGDECFKMHQLTAAQVNDAHRPLIEQAEKNGDGAAAADDQSADAWKADKIRDVFSAGALSALDAAGIVTLGELQEKMNRHGQFWAKELGVHGRWRTAIEDTFNAHIMKRTGTTIAEAAKGGSDGNGKADGDPFGEGSEESENVPIHPPKASKGKKKK
jgi:hypothetical protein